MEGVIHFNRAGPESGDPIAPAAVFRAGKKVPPDAVSLLMEDHRNVLGWFDWYDREQDAGRRALVVSIIIRALRAHMTIEEEIFYPQAAEATGAEKLVERSVKEHEQASALTAEAAKDPAGAVESMRMLRKDLEKHIEEEERELFPQVRKSDLDLYAVGRSIAARRVDVLHQLQRGEPL